MTTAELDPLIQRWIQRYNEREREIVEYDAALPITAVQLVMLAAIKAGAARPRDLIQVLDCPPNRPGPVLNRLAAAGLVTRRLDKDDARGIVLRLTPEGRRVLKENLPKLLALMAEREKVSV